MTTRTPPLPSADTDTERSSHPFLSVVLPTALTLAAVLGIGVWLLHAGRPDTPVAAPAVEQRTAIASEEVVTGVDMGSLAALEDGLGSVRRTEGAQIVYLVGSAEQADAIRRGLAEADAIRADVAAPPLTLRTAVLVIAAEEEEQILRALGDAGAIRDSLGQPGLMVVDLRAPT